MGILPILLTAVFAAASAVVGAFSPTLTVVVLLYTTLPVAFRSLATGGWASARAALQRRSGGLRHSTGGTEVPRGLKPTLQEFLTDCVTILLLWLPIEFAGAVASLIPRHAQGFLHTVIYILAIVLALAIFRDLPGKKINLPRSSRDLWLPLVAFAITAPVLIAVGIPIGFIPAPHLPTATVGKMAAGLGLIFALTALPEEILFRSLIQNLIMRRFGEGNGPLLVASVIFGAAHLDNGPQPLPNWRYAILATIAGFAYGKIYYKSKTVCSSAILHTLVDWTKHFFF